jgi:hypothetical protein
MHCAANIWSDALIFVDGLDWCVDVWIVPLSPMEKFKSPVLTFNLLMAWILQRTDDWQHYTRVRVLSIASDARQIPAVMQKVKKLCSYCRIIVDVQVCDGISRVISLSLSLSLSLSVCLSLCLRWTTNCANWHLLRLVRSFH